jgi:hypothetical protein
MKKKGGFLGGFFVFLFVIVIFGGVGFLGYNIIYKGNMSNMNMSSDNTSTDTKSTSKSDTNTAAANDNTNNSPTDNGGTTAATNNSYKISQMNQIMMNKQVLDSAIETINSSLKHMTLDPYAADTETGSSRNNQAANDTQLDKNSSATANGTTVNIYTNSSNQTMQMQSMGQTYDADRMEKLHSGLYKVSVGMQLLDNLRSNINIQSEQAGIDVASEAEYYLNQYYATIKEKNQLNEALTYINQAVDLININPYIDANGVVYSKEKMTQLHDSIYAIAQGVVDLNQLNDNLLQQAVQVGNLAQNAYSKSQAAVSNSMNSMSMTGTSSSLLSSLNISTILNFVLIIFVVIFIIGLLGSVLKLFKTDKLNNEQRL